jgi:putative transcriptional regulator
MAKIDFYAMTDMSIAKEFGKRLEQIRLESNIPQKEIAKEVGITEVTYRSAIKGKAKFEVIIGIMRVLGKLENLEDFLPNQPYSPMELLKLEGKKRQRAGSKRIKTEVDSQEDENW